MTPKEYSENYNIGLRRVYRMIDREELQTYVDSLGALQIIVDIKNNYSKLSQPQKDYNIKQANERLGEMILIGYNTPTAGLMRQIEPIIRQYQALGITFKGKKCAGENWETKEHNKYDIVGYDYRSVDRNKKRSKTKSDRKTRSDKHFYRDENVNKVLYSHILPLAAYIYLNSAKANILRTLDQMIDYSKTDENFYEIAAINEKTLYRVLTQEFAALGLEEKHELLNHYNKWFVKKTYCTGAFTDDIPFGTILMDDNKRNVASAWVYNSITRKNELKQIKSWNAIESRTGKYLSFKNDVKDFKADDTIELLVKALQVMGCTKVIVDNGIASSKEFQNFVTNLNYALREIYGLNAYQLEYEIAKPYHPTDKSPIERSFGITKDELDVDFKNFVGDNHKEEGIHKTNSLTPDQADYTFADYNKKYEQYIYGWYETRTRTLTIDGMKKRTCIRDYFDELFQTFDYKPIPERALRYALQKQKDYTFKGRFYLNIEGYQSDFIPVDFGTESLPSSFINRRYKILYNPANLNEVDLYTAESFIDKIHGIYYEAGQFVCTLQSVRELGTEKQKLVAIHNSSRQKEARKLALKLLPIDVMASINEAGKVEDTPKKVQKEIARIINDEMPLEKIAVEASEKIEQKNHTFSIEELDEIINEKEPGYFAGTEEE